MKVVRDLTDQGVSDMHARSVLIGILDPMTRQHTTNKLYESFNVFKTAVLEFTTAAGMLQKDVSKLDPCRWKVLQVQHSVQVFSTRFWV